MVQIIPAVKNKNRKEIEAKTDQNIKNRPVKKIEIENALDQIGGEKEEKENTDILQVTTQIQIPDLVLGTGKDAKIRDLIIAGKEEIEIGIEIGAGIEEEEDPGRDQEITTEGIFVEIVIVIADVEATQAQDLAVLTILGLGLQCKRMGKNAKDSPIEPHLHLHIW